MDTKRQEYTHIAQQLAAQLGETEKPPRAQIRQILQTIGPARTQAFVDQALEVEASGGMLLPVGSRKRTLGGVFFRLVRDQVSEADRRRIWPYPTQKGHTHRKQVGPAPTPTQLPPFQWEQADEVIATVTSHPGAATTVKVTIIGRPGEIVERQGV